MPGDSTLLASVGKIKVSTQLRPALVRTGFWRWPIAARRQPASTVGGGERGGAEEEERGSRREEREGGGGHCPQAGYGLCWIHTYLPKIQLVYIFVFISLVSLVCMLIQCLLCYGTATRPHRQNRSLTKTAPQSFN